MLSIDQCSETKLELKTKKNDMRNGSTNVSNDTTFNGITNNKCTSELTQGSQVKSNNIDNNNLGGKFLISEIIIIILYVLGFSVQKKLIINLKVIFIFYIYFKS